MAGNLAGQRPYGAFELKQSYQQGLAWALLTAALLHLAAVCAFKLYGELFGVSPGPIVDLPPVATQVDLLPPLVVKRPPLEVESYHPPASAAPDALKGVPVPVEDMRVTAPRLTPTRAELEAMTGTRVGPEGTGTSQGSERGLGPIGLPTALPEIGTHIWTTRDPEPLPGQPRPDYPELARLMEAEGVVTLRILISDSGDVLKVVCIDRPGSISPLLVDAASETVKRWRFIPALQQDRHVAVWFNQSFRFSLQKD